MTYRAATIFFDQSDKMHLYREGDIYPRRSASDGRIAELVEKGFIIKEGGGDNGNDICNDRGHSDADKASDDTGAKQGRGAASDSELEAQADSE